MKLPFYFTALLLIIVSSKVIAQNNYSDTSHAGVFKTYNDFINNKISYEVNLKDSNQSFTQPGITRKIKIKLNDTTTIKLKHGTFYGYYYKGEKFRYYEAQGNTPIGYFLIIDTAKLIIYSHLEHHSRYGSYLKYYYSMDYKNRIYELSYENLKTDFMDNPVFLELIKNEKNLFEKTANGITKVNELLIPSFK